MSAKFFAKGTLFSSEIEAHESVEKLVSVKLTDETARIVMARDIGGVLGKDISYDLVDGIVSLFLEGRVHLRKGVTDLKILFVLDRKFYGVFVFG